MRHLLGQIVESGPVLPAGSAAAAELVLAQRGSLSENIPQLKTKSIKRTIQGDLLGGGPFWPEWMGLGLILIYKKTSIYLFIFSDTRPILFKNI